MINRQETFNNTNSEVKTYENWKGSFSEYLNIGDLVDQEMVDYAINVLSPATMNYNMIQIGEPYSHREDKDRNWKATYATYVRTDEGWTYAGNCFRGQYTNMN